jgi:hypothetical protein
MLLEKEIDRVIFRSRITIDFNCRTYIGIHTVLIER